MIHRLRTSTSSNHDHHVPNRNSGDVVLPRASGPHTGILDRLVGGVGMRRGRRDPQHLRVGEALDFWRVEELKPGRLLRLRAEMRLPGRAWLEMRAEPTADGGSRYRQRAVFIPRGLAGHAYWAAVWPFHAIVFGGMARNIGHTAERNG